MRRFILVLFVLILSISCNESDRELDSDMTIVRDWFRSEFYTGDLLRQVHRIAVYDTSFNQVPFNSEIEEACIEGVIIQKTNGTYPITLTIDFGSDTGDTCLDSYKRKGKIIATLHDKYWRLKKGMVIQTEDFYFQGIQVDARDSIYRDSDSILYSTIRNAVLENDTYYTVYSANRQITWYEGKVPSDDTHNDRFEIRGNSKGFGNHGNTYTCEIDDRLLYQYSCGFLSSGNATVKPKNLYDRKVAFGIGCDKLVSASVVGKDYNLEFD